MVDTDSQYHNEVIIDQFTKQAIPFTQNAAHSAEYAVKRLITLSDVSKKDIVLDVACGSGLVSCELARVAHHITGIDIRGVVLKRIKTVIIRSYLGMRNTN